MTMMVWMAGSIGAEGGGWSAMVTVSAVGRDLFWCLRAGVKRNDGERDGELFLALAVPARIFKFRKKEVPKTHKVRYQFGELARVGENCTGWMTGWSSPGGFGPSDIKALVGLSVQ